MATLRTLNVDLRAGTARLASDFEKANGIIGRFQNNARTQFDSIRSSASRVVTSLDEIGATVAKSQRQIDANSRDIHASNQKIISSLSVIGGLLAAPQINKLTGDFVNFGNVISALFAGRLVGQMAQYSREVLGTVVASTQQRNAILAAAEAATRHHRTLTAQYSATVAAGQASTVYAQYLREQLAASTAVTIAAREQAVGVSLARTAFATLGGPVGVITVAASALALWATSASSADDEIKKLNASTKDLSDTTDKLSSQVLAQRILNLQDALSKISSNPAGAAKLKEMIAGYRKVLEDDATLQDRISNVLQSARKRDMPAAATSISGDSAEEFGRRMADLARQAYPVATQSAEEYGIEQAKISQEWLRSIESAEEYGKRMFDLARVAYPTATQSAEEYAIAMRDQITASMQSVEQIRESLMTDEESLTAAYESRAEIISNAVQQQIVTESEARDMLLKLEEDYQTRLSSVRKKGISDVTTWEKMNWKDRTKTLGNELTMMTAQVATQNRAMFEISRIGAIANAIVNTHEGVTKTLSAYPQPLAGILAAGHLAAGLAQVSAIRSASFGGGGGGGGGSLGGGAVPTFPANPVTALPEPSTLDTRSDRRTQQITLILPPDQGLVSTDWIRNTLIPQLNDAAEDGVAISGIRVN